MGCIARLKGVSLGHRTEKTRVTSVKLHEPLPGVPVLASGGPFSDRHPIVMYGSRPLDSDRAGR